MKNIRIIILIAVLFGIIPNYANAQRSKGKDRSQKENKSKIAKESDDVEIVCYGEGNTLDEATKVALRSGIEQTYGAFVSSNTEFLNDGIIKDEISTVASGNIKKYDIISQAQIDNKWCVTVKALISTGRLTSYVQSHGGSTELAGATFAMNIRMEQLNAQAEKTILNNLAKQLNEVTKCMYDYSIVVGEPHGGYEGWEVPVKVICRVNSNVTIFYKLFMETITSLSLPTEAAKQRVKNGLQVWPLIARGGSGYQSDETGIPITGGYGYILKEKSQEEARDARNALKDYLLNDNMTYYYSKYFSSTPICFLFRTWTFERFFAKKETDNFITNNMLIYQIDDGAERKFRRVMRSPIIYISQENLLITPVAPGTKVAQSEGVLAYRSLEDVSKVKKITIQSASCQHE